MREKLNVLRILRAHHWVKNLLVFFPLVLVTNDQLPYQFFRGVEAFVIFSIAASLVYIFNDVLDYQYDRTNPSKSDRPIATNKVTKIQIVSISSLLFVLLVYFLWSFGSIIVVPIIFYLLGNIVYSTLIKKIVFFDLILIATFFHLRLYSGAQNMHVELNYMYYFVGLFCFLGLAALKRYVEISHHPERVPGRAYTHAHQRAMSIFSLICALVTTILLALSLRDSQVIELYRHPWYLMLLVPLFIGEVVLLIYKARYKKLSEDLTTLWSEDRASQIFFITVLMILVLAR